MRRKLTTLATLAAIAAFGCLLTAGCEKKTVTTTTETEKTDTSNAPTPAPTPMMSETPVAPSTTPSP